MKLNKVPQIAKIAWSTLLVSSFVMNTWSKESAVFSFIIVTMAWVGVRIITEAMEAAISLIQPTLPPPPKDSTEGGWSKDNW